jgi:hypothetical protein
MNIKSDAIYYFKKDRKQRSWIFINSAVACIFYIVGLFCYEIITEDSVSESFKTTYVLIFTVSATTLFWVAWWHRTHPATYEAIITRDRFIVSYPNSTYWSFNVKISDIKRFENRGTLSNAGQGGTRSGILLHGGTFHEVCMNYGCNIGKMHTAIKNINPSVTFPKKINRKVSGGFTKDYDN